MWWNMEVKSILVWNTSGSNQGLEIFKSCNLQLGTIIYSFTCLLMSITGTYFISCVTGFLNDHYTFSQISLDSHSLIIDFNFSMWIKADLLFFLKYSGGSLPEGIINPFSKTFKPTDQLSKFLYYTYKIFQNEYLQNYLFRTLFPARISDYRS